MAQLVETSENSAASSGAQLLREVLLQLLENNLCQCVVCVAQAVETGLQLTRDRVVAHRTWLNPHFHFMIDTSPFSMKPSFDRQLAVEYRR